MLRELEHLRSEGTAPVPATVRPSPASSAKIERIRAPQLGPVAGVYSTYTRVPESDIVMGVNSNVTGAEQQMLSPPATAKRFLEERHSSTSASSTASSSANADSTPIGSAMGTPRQGGAGFVGRMRAMVAANRESVEPTGKASGGRHSTTTTKTSNKSSKEQREAGGVRQTADAVAPRTGERGNVSVSEAFARARIDHVAPDRQFTRTTQTHGAVKSTAATPSAAASVETASSAAHMTSHSRVHQSTRRT